MGKRENVSSGKIVRNVVIALAVLLALGVLIVRNLENKSLETRLNQQLWQNENAGSLDQEPRQTGGATRLKQQLEQERAEALERLRAMETRVYLARQTRVP